MLDSRYELIIAKPTPKARGMNKALSGSSMIKAGIKTDKMQASASKRATAVMLLPLRTARARDAPPWNCAWMFSTSTVASSTKMPMANAKPPSDMILMLLPVKYKPNRDPKRASGIFATTTITLRQSPKNNRIINPVSAAPITPSVPTLLMAVNTVGDSSNSKLILTSGGNTSRKAGMAAWIFATTSSVLAVSFFKIGK